MRDITNTIGLFEEAVEQMHLRASRQRDDIYFVLREMEDMDMSEREEMEAIFEKVNRKADELAQIRQILTLESELTEQEIVTLRGRVVAVLTDTIHPASAAARLDPTLEITYKA